MRTISTTKARSNLSELLDEVNRTGHTIKIGKHGKVQGLLSPAPQWNPTLSDTTNMMALSGSFDFLYDEPDIYTDKDIKRKV